NKDKATHLPEEKYHDLEKRFDDVKKELHKIWQQLN
ncbi:plasmid mobilization relaxosome protein MobC, partial [Escherichia coli]|nr:plasmid mobilization relaxosome protein MobC [Escherichia coli]